MKNISLVFFVLQIQRNSKTYHSELISALKFAKMESSLSPIINSELQTTLLLDKIFKIIK